MVDSKGIVENSFELKAGDSAKYVISGLQVIEHPFPCSCLVLISFVVGVKHQVGTIRLSYSPATLGLGPFLDMLGSSGALSLRRCLSPLWLPMCIWPG